MAAYSAQPTVLLHIKADILLLRGIIDASRLQGWRVANLAYTSNYIPSRLPPIGAIIDGVPPASTLTRIEDLRIPIVCSRNHEYRRTKCLPALLENRHAAGRLAAERFLDRGFRDLAYVAFAQEVISSELLAGFKEATRRVKGCNLHLLPLETPSSEGNSAATYEQHVLKISDWLGKCPTPLGILAHNYRMGARIIAACEIAGLQVPEQVAILCRGNWPDLCETAPVPISAIDMNDTERGRQLVLMLKRMLKGGPAPRKPLYVSPKGIVERRSTDILAVPDLKVAAAIRYMWDYLGQSIDVEDVADHIGISRRSLERLFSRYLGRGIGAELHRKRLERARELLRGTRMTVSEIVKAIGLSDKRYLHRAFKTAYGLTPRQYRNQGES